MLQEIYLLLSGFNVYFRFFSFSQEPYPFFVQDGNRKNKRKNGLRVFFKTTQESGELFSNFINTGWSGEAGADQRVLKQSKTLSNMMHTFNIINILSRMDSNNAKV